MELCSTTVPGAAVLKGSYFCLENRCPASEKLAWWCSWSPPPPPQGTDY